MGVHVQRQGDNVHIAGALAVAEEGALHPLAAGQYAHFSVGYSAAPVVVGVQRQNHIFPVFQVPADILHLAGIDMGHREGYC